MSKYRNYAEAILERACKSAAQSAILALGAQATGAIDVLHTDWLTILGLAGGGFVLSVLTSVASSGVGGNGPSLANETVVDPVNVNEIPDDPA
jgi:hypothetical protein